MLKFIDLFAGMGGIRLGLEQACQEFKIKTECVFTAELKKYAISTYNHNFKENILPCDITKVEPNIIPDHDLLLAGFPCQAFSHAGKQLGFEDTRGTLFFNVANILKHKKPSMFLLENVEGLTTHDHGKTFATILGVLNDLGYYISYDVINSIYHNVPQERKRIFIIGSLNNPNISIKNLPQSNISPLSNILEEGLPELKSELTTSLNRLFPIHSLYGKSINDKRGGNDNIHSWDLEIKGTISSNEKELLSRLLLERRRKIWAKNKGIKWSDGMPLSFEDIYSFSSDLFNKEELTKTLNLLVDKKYLSYEKPKETKNGIRNYVNDLDFGYNISTGRLSFEINRILDPNKTTGTLVATDLDRLAIIDEKHDKKYIRKLSQRELLRLSGFPENYTIPKNINHKQFCDLIGNTVCVTVIKSIFKKTLKNNH